jgi:hypothetical protein
MDMGMDMQPPDFAMPDMAVPTVLTGTQVVNARGASLMGVTTDDDIVYQNSNQDLRVVHLDGSNDAQIAAAADWGGMQISGKVVFYWDNNSPANLFAWTRAAGSNALATAFAPGNNQVLYATTDGTRVMFDDNATVDSGGSGVAVTADLIISDLSGANKTTLETGIFFSGGCDLTAGQAGSFFFAAHCNAGQDAGAATPSTIKSYATTNGAAHILWTGVQNNWTTNKAGDTIAVIDFDNTLKVRKSDASTASADIASNVGVVIVKDNGDSIVLTKDGDLKIYTGGSLQAIVTGGAYTGGFWSVAKDNSAALMNANFDTTSNSGDVIFVPLTPGATATPMVAGTTGWGLGFTGDSSTFTWLDNVDAMTGVGDFYTAAAASPGTAHKQISATVYDSTEGAGQRVIAYSNFMGSQTSASRTDLTQVNVTSNATNLIATQTDYSSLWDQSRTKLIYVFNAKMTGAGIYVVDIQ